MIITSKLEFKGKKEDPAESSVFIPIFIFTKRKYTSVIIRDFWTVTFEHTNLRFLA